MKYQDICVHLIINKQTHLYNKIHVKCAQSETSMKVNKKH